MLRHWAVCLAWLWLCVGHSDASSQHKTASGKLPVTTSSALARKHFEKAMQNVEYVRRDDALNELREAAKADPQFVQALILISHLSPDPEEQRSTRARARQLAPHVSVGEQMLVQWLAGVQEDHYVPAIAAMNDLLARYPQDQRLGFLAGSWLVKQERYPQAEVVLKRTIALAPNYPAALNELGYAYAFGGDFEKGFAAMERYVALQPSQPNPHDSYGEILRRAGKFDAALEQYRMSIQIDPNFGSELGVADTYSLMGKEEEARDEYQRAIVFTTSESDKVAYELQSALTWVREGDHKQAEKALHEVARHAHAAGLGRLEAEAHVAWALYEPDYKQAMKQVEAAQEALAERHAMARTDQDEEQARVWQAQVLRASEAQDWISASAAIKQLDAMAQTSRNQIVQRCYHGATGALLEAQTEYADAIPHLEEDSANPVSMRLLWRAYDHTGAAAQAAALAVKLSMFEVPTLEQALVVPQFRASIVSKAERP